MYKIAHFRVIPNNRPVRFTNSTFRLIFHAGTTIFGHGDPSIPREAWSFYDTAEIERCRGTFSHLIGNFFNFVCIVIYIDILVYSYLFHRIDRCS